MDKVAKFKRYFSQRTTYKHQNDCDDCGMRSYGDATKYGIPAGVRVMESHAAYSIPCAKHDRDARWLWWIADVPDEAIAERLAWRAAFALCELQKHLPKDHPEYRG